MSTRILHYSDIENAYDEPDRIGRIAQALRDRRDGETLVCGTGDTTAPGLLSMETGGEHALPFFETVSPDYATFGNHDFDVGLEGLRRIVERSPQTWLVANLYRDDDRLFGADLGVRRTAITEVGDRTLGLVGVTDPGTLHEHAYAESLTVTDPTEAVADALERFDSRDLDHVVVLSHAGLWDDDIASIDGIDLVLGGHLHDRRADAVDGTPVVHPGERGDVLGEIELRERRVEATLRDVTDASVAPEVADTYRELYADLGLAETVGRVESPIPRTRDDLFPESALGNLVADAYRWAGGADVALFHPLMLRTGSPLDGDVSVGDLRALVPFDNELHTARLDGEELRALFESVAAPDAFDIGLEVFGHVSGARLAWRRTDDGIELVEATVGGEQPESGRSYTVVAPGFEFSSDLFPVLTHDLRGDTHGHQHDAVVEYVREHGIDAERDGRMRAVEDAASAEFHSLR